MSQVLNLLRTEHSRKRKNGPLAKISDASSVILIAGIVESLTANYHFNGTGSI
jgi:hypothetical protein